MKQRITEIVAVLVTVLGIGLTILAPRVYENRSHSKQLNTRVITLTGVRASGTWTDEEVNGWNYWWREFRPARLVLKPDEMVRLRLKSADVVHTFYIPALGIGPLEVQPGHVVETEVTPTQEGVFQYYCTMVCGMPHFAMRGEVVVQRDGLPVPATAALPVAGKYWLEPAPRRGASVVERGRWLFRQRGCFTCHGPEAGGGVDNWNYVKGTTPALNTLAEKLMLFDPEDVKAILEQMERGRDLESLTDSPPVPRFHVFLAQYRAVRDVVRNGSPPGKKDPQGPDPPLQMLAWGQRLSDTDINAIIAYLLTLQPNS